MMKILLLSAVGALSAAVSIPAADATVLLTFGQTSTGDTVTATRSGSTTTITSDTPVDIDDIAAPLATPILATLVIDATSTGTATLVAGNVVQPYSGTFSITSGATNYLSGMFTDAIFGSGGSLTLSASDDTPGESVTFTSSVITANLLEGFERSIALSFTDVSPPANITAGTLRGFSSDVSGDFSATAVPEPATWAMLGLGFAGMGLLGLTRRRKGARYAF
jgi:hypothetical protein